MAVNMETGKRRMSSDELRGCETAKNHEHWPHRHKNALQYHAFRKIATHEPADDWASQQRNVQNLTYNACGHRSAECSTKRVKPSW